MSLATLQRNRRPWRVALWAVSSGVAFLLGSGIFAYIIYMALYISPVLEILMYVPYLIAATFTSLLVRNIDRSKPWATVVGFVGVTLWIAHGLVVFTLFH